MKERSGTTQSLRMMNLSRIDPPFGCWFPLEQSSRGGPVGEGMRVTVAGAWGAAAAPGRRRSGKASVAAAVREMGVRGMLYIPQRHYICTDRCLRANLRRRGVLPPAEPQVRQKKKKKDTHTPSLILTLLPFPLFFDCLSLTFLRADARGPIIVCRLVSQPVTLGRFLRWFTP